MKRILRWALNGITVLSVVLFLTAGGLWVRSYFRADWISRRSIDKGTATIGQMLDIYSNIGGFDIEHRALAIKPGRVISSRRRELLELQLLDGIHQNRWIWYARQHWHGLGYWRTLRWFNYYWYLESHASSDPALEEAKFNIALPYWVPALLFIMLPAVRGLLALHRRSKINQVGKCRRCGYDLRATPDRCPECGTVARKSIA